MCFLLGGLRFREQVKGTSASFFGGLLTSLPQDLQQHGDTDERLFAQFKCYEPFTTGMFFRAREAAMILDCFGRKRR